MAQILVTGGNGFLGSWLIRRLIADGHKVRCLVRPKSDLSELQGLPCEYVHGDVTQKESLLKAMQGQEAVFHLAGLIAYRKADRAAMERVNVQGTQNVIEAVLESRVPRLVHLSSVVAIGAGFSARQVLNEESTFNVHHLDLGYFETKWRAEQLVRKAVQERGLDAVILNPSTIYGPGDARKGSRKTQLKVAQGRFRFYTSGGVNVVPVENCVDGIIRAWTSGKSGERYILAGQNLTIRELFQTIAQAAGVHPPPLYMPNFVLHLIGMTGDLLNRLGFALPLSRENAWTATLFHWFDSGKAQRELGFEPGSSKAAIAGSVAWMKEKNLLDSTSRSSR